MAWVEAQGALADGPGPRAPARPPAETAKPEAAEMAPVPEAPVSVDKARPVEAAKVRRVAAPSAVLWEAAWAG
ncbi:hypothetical protein MAE02_09650 [Microvirga aerophila]|uniref:Uncharacterized protein n=1 Tax=Microvirga aerophila TaxID=670291 RepID=A0A512BMT8_9HYPH|nr:hypothetical protein MAE02_09650 [Microvirga aerophila]